MRGLNLHLRALAFSLGLFAQPLWAQAPLPAAARTDPQAGMSLSSLDLRRAEQMALARAPELMAEGLEPSRRALQREAHTATILPQLSASSSLSGPTPQSFSMGLNARQTLPNPWLWQHESASLDASYALANSQWQRKQQEVLRDLRLQYFGLFYCRAKADLQRESLALLGELKALSAKRFANGFIDQSDLLRTSLQYDSSQGDLTATELSCEVEAQKLGRLIGWQGPGMELATSLQELVAHMQRQLDQAAWSEGVLRQLVSEQESFALAEESHRLSIAEHDRDKAYHQLWTPEVSLGLSVPFYEKQWGRDGGVTTPRPSYELGVSWQLFAGGRDHYAHRSSVLDYQEKGFRHSAAQLAYQQTTSSLIAELLALKARWLRQREAGEAWKGLVNQSKQRFLQGLASSRDVNDDLANLLRQKEKNLDIIDAMTGKIINLAFELRKPDLIFNAIK